VAVAAALSLAAAWASTVLATDPVLVVQPGQTLSEIALQHGVSVEQLATVNGISDPNRIYVGQRLRLVPGKGQAPAPATHVVAYGENLTTIARRHGTTVAALATANGLANPSLIRVGQELVLPAGAAGSAASAGPVAVAEGSATTHRVAYGETISAIALRYRTSLTALAAANGLVNPSYIRVGQLLTVPGAGSATAKPAPPSGSGLPASMAARVVARDAVRRLIVDEATRQGVPPALALAVAWQESGWQQGVVSSSGAIGVMQLLPATGDWVSGSMLAAPVNLWDAGSNIRAGVRLLRHYVDRYDGDRALVLAAYYQGQSAVDRNGIYAVTRPYIDSILVLERLFAR
jgi:LysM repeat protein